MKNKICFNLQHPSVLSSTPVIPKKNCFEKYNFEFSRIILRRYYFHRNSIPVSLRRDRKSYTEELHYCNSLHSGRSISFHTKIQEAQHWWYKRNHNDSHLTQNVTVFFSLRPEGANVRLRLYPKQTSIATKNQIFFSKFVTF